MVKNQKYDKMIIEANGGGIGYLSLSLMPIV